MDKQDRTIRFKSCHVGKGRNLHDEFEKLPKEMQSLWTRRDFRKFLAQFRSLLVSRKLKIEDVNAILPFLPELSMSYDRGIHLLIDNCYLKCESFANQTRDEAGLLRTLARSSNSYLRRTITENCKVSPTSEQSLALSTNLLTMEDIKKQTLDEDTIPGESQKSDVCTSLDISPDFIKKLYYYPLKLRGGKFPPRPGVYFISYIGKKELYPGSQVDALIPVYVGMSKKSIRKRLNDHRRKIEKAQNLEVTDFVVQFMIVDESSVGDIESKLIERFSPVWNSNGASETPRFSFGSGRNSKTLWNKCHVQADKETLETMVDRLSIKDKGLKTGPEVLFSAGLIFTTA